jgi:DNA topoisomerase IB
VRRKRGKGFEYFLGATGAKVTDAEMLTRIRELVIPPAWTDVWISPQANGHIQALGIDAAGRKQYLYHPKWRESKDQEKFVRMMDFARSLPEVRRTCTKHLADEGMTRRKALACAVRLLDRGFFRVGSEAYADQNETYGLATIQKRHVVVEGDTIIFDYQAKGNKRRMQSVVDPQVAAAVNTLKRRRGGGPELLAYKQGARWFDIRSVDINAYIKEVTGGDFSAKDFRTWNATVLAAVAVAVAGENATSETARKRVVSHAIKEAAYYLGNTPAVCRKSYVDPRVFDRYKSGWTIGRLDELGEVKVYGELPTQGAIELAVIDLLEERSSDSVQRVA